MTSPQKPYTWNQCPNASYEVSTVAYRLKTYEIMLQEAFQDLKPPWEPHKDIQGRNSQMSWLIFSDSLLIKQNISVCW